MCSLFFFFLMIRRPPRSTLDRSSAASDVYKRQVEQLLHHFQHASDRDLAFKVAAKCGDDRRHVNLHVVAPVSYTHLRAHETVLDLVCRLLLEKKNTQNLITTYLLCIDVTT
mgnify:CR=1 FL=1